MRIPLFATLALIAACAGGAPPDMSPKLVPGIPVQNWTVDVVNPPSRDIYFRNDDSVPRVIVDLQLFACENMKQVCQVYTPNLLISPGRTVKAMRLGPDRTTLPWKYQFTFHSRGVYAPQVREVMPTGKVIRSFSRTGPLPYVGLGSVEEFHARVSGPSGQASCSRNSQAQGLAGGPTLAMYFAGTGGNGGDGVMVYVDLDAQNNPNLYTEMRGSFRDSPGTPGNDLLPAHTIVSIRVQRRTAELVNEGGNRPPEYFAVGGPDLMTAASLGRPGEILARIIKECGATTQIDHP